MPFSPACLLLFFIQKLKTFIHQKTSILMFKANLFIISQIGSNPNKY